MPATSFIHIKSAKFPILPGEDEELINEGTYGKALCLYLQARLQERSYDVPCILCEDWGWWVEIGGQPYALALCVYAYEDLPETQELCVTVSQEPGRKWIWRQFKFIDTTERVNGLFSDLQEIFAADPEIETLGISDVFPMG